MVVDGENTLDPCNQSTMTEDFSCLKYPENPNPENGYRWRVEASYYNDSYIDPSMAVGEYIYVGIEGRSNASNNTFNLNGTIGDSATKG